jgi:tetratricopeptide (TPR) repeat protein
MDSRAPNVDELLRIAREDISRNSLTSAEKTLEQAILMNHTEPEAFHLLGYVYSKRGKFKKAILAFQKTLNLDPFHTDAAIALSSLLNDVGKYKEGAAVFFKTKKRLDETAPGHDPRINENLGRLHYELGLLYMRFERFREAHHEFSKAYHLQPENLSAAVQMAKCLARSGEKQKAIEFLRKTIESHPDHVEAKLQLGVLYHSLQKLKEARRLWEEALTQEPENKSAQMYLSMLDYEPGAARL